MMTINDNASPSMHFARAQTAGRTTIVFSGEHGFFD